MLLDLGLESSLAGEGKLGLAEVGAVGVETWRGLGLHLLETQAFAHLGACWPTLHCFFLGVVSTWPWNITPFLVLSALRQVYRNACGDMFGLDVSAWPWNCIKSSVSESICSANRERFCFGDDGLELRVVLIRRRRSVGLSFLVLPSDNDAWRGRMIAIMRRVFRWSWRSCLRFCGVSAHKRESLSIDGAGLESIDEGVLAG